MARNNMTYHGVAVLASAPVDSHEHCYPGPVNDRSDLQWLLDANLQIGAVLTWCQDVWFGGVRARLYHTWTAESAARVKRAAHWWDAADPFSRAYFLCPPSGPWCWRDMEEKFGGDAYARLAAAARDAYRRIGGVTFGEVLAVMRETASHHTGITGIDPWYRNLVDTAWGLIRPRVRELLSEADRKQFYWGDVPTHYHEFGGYREWGMLVPIWDDIHNLPLIAPTE